MVTKTEENKTHKENTLTRFGDFTLLKDIKNDISIEKQKLKARILKGIEENGYVAFLETGESGVVKDVSVYYKVWAIEKDRLKW